MSETILRTTQEQSGNYAVFAAATVGGFQPMKGFAIHHDITGRLPDGTEYVNVALESEGKLDLQPVKATTATVQYASEGSAAVRHVYLDPEFLAEFGEVDFKGKETDLSALPTVSIANIEASSEEEYEQAKEEANSAEEEADALFGEDSDDSEDADSDESEADADDEEVEISDEEVGIVEN